MPFIYDTWKNIIKLAFIPQFLFLMMKLTRGNVLATLAYCRVRAIIEDTPRVTRAGSACGYKMKHDKIFITLWSSQNPIQDMKTIQYVGK